ncbi:hypothetical protein CW304_00830 [Bacillus sp. UFRGS-B20]|nr:hypothetical protein CW304_00830 [Bacillus sp. UFRGS-B20]
MFVQLTIAIILSLRQKQHSIRRHQPLGYMICDIFCFFCRNLFLSFQIFPSLSPSFTFFKSDSNLYSVACILKYLFSLLDTVTLASHIFLKLLLIK